MIDGKTLRTLRDAAQYITKLPKAEHDADEWQAAMRALLLVAEQDGPPGSSFIPADADKPRSGQCTDSPSEKSHRLLDDTPFVIDKL